MTAAVLGPYVDAFCLVVTLACGALLVWLSEPRLAEALACDSDGVAEGTGLVAWVAATAVAYAILGTGWAAAIGAVTGFATGVVVLAVRGRS